MKWTENIKLSDVFHDDDMTFPERRNAIVDRIRASRWYRRQDEFSDLHDIVAELAITSTEVEFDGLWGQLYDLADEDRIWVETVF